MTKEELFKLAYDKLQLETSTIQSRFDLLKDLQGMTDWTDEHNEILKYLAGVGGKR